MGLRNAKYFVPALFWAAVIFAVSSIPDLSALKVTGLTFSDKLAHIGEYSIFGAALAFAFHRGGWVGTIFLPSAIIGILYGAGDEFHQYFVPGRSCDPFDLVADSIGVVVGLSIYLWYSRRISKAIPQSSGDGRAGNAK